MNDGPQTHCVRCHDRLEMWRSVLDNLCPDCFADACFVASQNKVLFQVLREQGVDRKTANVMLIAKVHHDAAKEAPAPS